MPLRASKAPALDDCVRSRGAISGSRSCHLGMGACEWVNRVGGIKIINVRCPFFGISGGKRDPRFEPEK